MNPHLNFVESIFEYNFNDKSILQQALTHRSTKNTKGNNYERLEFLGDRVLGLVIANLLIRRFPAASEGEIARRHTALVREETLAEIARNVHLNCHIIASEGIQNKDSVLADVLEACIGAIYYDGGFNKILPFINAHFSPLVELNLKDDKDPKSILQEWSQKAKLGLPIYDMIERTGTDHEPNFVMQVSVKQYQSGIGNGNSKQRASQNAAVDFIKKNGIMVI